MAPESDGPGGVITVFVCDDSAAERFLMGQLIKGRPGLYLAGAASSAIGAVEAIKSAQPDVVLLDHLDHEGDVSIIVRAIREVHPSVKVIVRSGLPASRIAGVSSADAYVGKEPEPESLWQAIDELAERD